MQLVVTASGLTLGKNHLPLLHRYYDVLFMFINSPAIYLLSLVLVDRDTGAIFNVSTNTTIVFVAGVDIKSEAF